MSLPAAWAVAAATWLGAMLGAPGLPGPFPGRWPTTVASALAVAGAAGLVAAALLGDRDGDVDAAGRPSRPARLALVCVAAAVLAAGLAGTRASLPLDGSVAARAGGGPVPIEAVAVTDLRGSDGGWQVVRVVELDGRPVRERAWWWLQDEETAPTVGQRVTATVSVEPLREDGLDLHAARLHAGARLRVLELDGPPVEAGWLLASTQHVRDRFRTASARALKATHAWVLTALVTGDRRGEPPELREEFAAAGLAHLVVVSGRHVAVLLAGVLAVTSLAGLGARPRRVVALAALAWFVVLTRWQPSVLRAGVMASLVLLAGLSGRGADPRHALATAVTLLLLADPLLATQLGFGLSVSATAGVLLVGPWIAERLGGPRWLTLPVGVCLGAQAGAAPLLLTLDGIGAGSVPANLIAVPAAAAAQTIGVAAAALAAASVEAAAAVVWLADPFVWVIVWAAEAFAGGPRLTAGALTSAWTWLALAAAVGAVGLRRRWPSGSLLAGLTALALVVAPLPGRSPGNVDTLTATFLDVDQGLAVLVEAPDGTGGTARMLYDGGPDDRAADAYLAERRIDTLEVVALSHPHHDHSGGLPRVLAERDASTLLVGPEPVGADHAESVRETYAIAEERGIPTLIAAPGQRFELGTAEVRVLGPPPGGQVVVDEPNEMSVVLSIATADGRLLLPGDAEEAAQRWLLRHQPHQLRADVLQVAHHGGDTNADGFHAAVDARVGVIGVGADNAHGHPHPAVIDELARVGTLVYRTDLHGAITVTVEGGRVRVDPQRRPRRPLRPLRDRPRRPKRKTAAARRPRRSSIEGESIEAWVYARAPMVLRMSSSTSDAPMKPITSEPSQFTCCSRPIRLASQPPTQPPTRPMIRAPSHWMGSVGKRRRTASMAATPAMSPRTSQTSVSMPVHLLMRQQLDLAHGFRWRAPETPPRS